MESKKTWSDELLIHHFLQLEHQSEEERKFEESREPVTMIQHHILQISNFNFSYKKRKQVKNALKEQRENAEKNENIFLIAIQRGKNNQKS